MEDRSKERRTLQACNNLQCGVHPLAPQSTSPSALHERCNCRHKSACGRPVILVSTMRLNPGSTTSVCLLGVVNCNPIQRAPLTSALLFYIPERSPMRYLGLLLKPTETTVFHAVRQTVSSPADFKPELLLATFVGPSDRPTRVGEVANNGDC